MATEAPTMEEPADGQQVVEAEGENAEAPQQQQASPSHKRALEEEAEPVADDGAPPQRTPAPPPAKRRRKAKVAKRALDQDVDKDVVVLLDDDDDVQVVVLDASSSDSDAGDARAPRGGARTAPAALQTKHPVARTAAHQQAHQQGVHFVDSADDIVQSVELRRLVRPPRYFDEDAGAPEPSTKRCFHCGQMGHYSSTCTNAARDKPCHMCAQFGHEGRACPNRLCFRCGRAGHVSKDCTAGRAEGWESAAAVCNRCGSGEDCACVGKGDYFRYEGGCTGRYAPEDLKHCRCYVCGRNGHLCCQRPPTDPPFNVSCYCCGSTLHLGEQCLYEVRPHLAAERAGDARRAEALRQQDLDALLFQQATGDRLGGRRGSAAAPLPPQQRSQSVDPGLWRGHGGGGVAGPRFDPAGPGGWRSGTSHQHASNSSTPVPAGSGPYGGGTRPQHPQHDPQPPHAHPHGNGRFSTPQPFDRQASGPQPHHALAPPWARDQGPPHPHTAPPPPSNHWNSAAWESFEYESRRNSYAAGGDYDPVRDAPTWRPHAAASPGYGQGPGAAPSLPPPQGGAGGGGGGGGGAYPATYDLNATHQQPHHHQQPETQLPGSYQSVYGAGAHPAPQPPPWGQGPHPHAPWEQPPQHQEAAPAAPQHPWEAPKRQGSAHARESWAQQQQQPAPAHAYPPHPHDHGGGGGPHPHRPYGMFSDQDFGAYAPPRPHHPHDPHQRLYPY